MPTDFIILCGGQGTRLRSVIGESQKVMAAIGDEPFLDLLIKYIRAQGGQHVILATGYKTADVEAHYAGKFKDMKIEFSREDEPLGTGGAIKKACGLVKSDDFFVLNGDSFCPVKFDSVLTMHVNRSALVTLVVSKAADGKDYGVVEFDSHLRVKRFREKNIHYIGDDLSLWVNAGIYCFNSQIISRMPSLEKFSLEKDILEPLSKDKSEKIYVYQTEEPFFDIGTPERFELARRYLKGLDKKDVRRGTKDEIKG